MNLILLTPSDFTEEHTVRLIGRRCRHIHDVHQASQGTVLRVGLLNGRMGTGVVQSVSADAVLLKVSLAVPSPDALPVTLVLAMPRPKVFRRVIQCATTMGVKRIALFGSFRVEKSYWQSPWLGELDLMEQVTLGLEQARDTVPPVITLHPLFKPFMEDVIPELTAGSRRLVAHPGEHPICPGAVAGPVSLVLGPEGGFTDYELGVLKNAAFEPVTLGARILRTEQAVPAFLGRLMN